MKFKLLRTLTRNFPVERVRKFFDFTSYYFGGLWRKVEEDHIYLAAAGIAFSLILSMIPFLLIVFAILGSLISPEVLQHQINQFIETAIPYPDFAHYLENFIMRRLPGVFHYKNIAAYIGIFGLMFTTTWLFSSLRTILNHIFVVEKNKSAWYGLIKDFGVIILILVIMLLSTLVFPSIQILINSTLQLEILQTLRISQLMQSLLSLSSFFIIFLLFYFFYYIIPYERIGNKVIAISAFWAALLWAIMKYIFGYYVTYFLAAEKLYGAFLLVIVILFWIFYSSILFLLGAEIGMLYKKRNDL
jgi:membrane protein